MSSEKVCSSCGKRKSRGAKGLRACTDGTEIYNALLWWRPGEVPRLCRECQRKHTTAPSNLDVILAKYTEYHLCVGGGGGGGGGDGNPGGGASGGGRAPAAAYSTDASGFVGLAAVVKALVDDGKSLDLLHAVRVAMDGLSKLRNAGKLADVDLAALDDAAQSLGQLVRHVDAHQRAQDRGKAQQHGQNLTLEGSGDVRGVLRRIAADGGPAYSFLGSAFQPASHNEPTVDPTRRKRLFDRRVAVALSILEHACNQRALGFQRALRTAKETQTKAQHDALLTSLGIYASKSVLSLLMAREGDSTGILPPPCVPAGSTIRLGGGDNLGWNYKRVKQDDSGIRSAGHFPTATSFLVSADTKKEEDLFTELDLSPSRMESLDAPTAADAYKKPADILATDWDWRVLFLRVALAFQAVLVFMNLSKADIVPDASKAADTGASRTAPEIEITTTVSVGCSAVGVSMTRSPNRGRSSTAKTVEKNWLRENNILMREQKIGQFAKIVQLLDLVEQMVNDANLPIGIMLLLCSDGVPQGDLLKKLRNALTHLSGCTKTRTRGDGSIGPCICKFIPQIIPLEQGFHKHKHMMTTEIRLQWELLLEAAMAASRDTAGARNYVEKGGDPRAMEEELHKTIVPAICICLVGLLFREWRLQQIARDIDVLLHVSEDDGSHSSADEDDPPPSEAAVKAVYAAATAIGWEKPRDALAAKGVALIREQAAGAATAAPDSDGPKRSVRLAEKKRAAPGEAGEGKGGGGDGGVGGGGGSGRRTFPVSPAALPMPNLANHKNMDGVSALNWVLALATRKKSIWILVQYLFMATASIMCKEAIRMSCRRIFASSRRLSILLNSLTGCNYFWIDLDSIIVEDTAPPKMQLLFKLLYFTASMPSGRQISWDLACEFLNFLTKKFTPSFLVDVNTMGRRVKFYSRRLLPLLDERHRQGRPGPPAETKPYRFGELEITPKVVATVCHFRRTKLFGGPGHPPPALTDTSLTLPKGKKEVQQEVQPSSMQITKCAASAGGADIYRHGEAGAKAAINNAGLLDPRKYVSAPRGRNPVLEASAANTELSLAQRSFLHNNVDVDVLRKLSTTMPPSKTSFKTYTVTEITRRVEFYRDRSKSGRGSGASRPAAWKRGKEKAAREELIRKKGKNFSDTIAANWAKAKNKKAMAQVLINVRLAHLPFTLLCDAEFDREQEASHTAGFGRILSEVEPTITRLARLGAAGVPPDMVHSCFPPVRGSLAELVCTASAEQPVDDGAPSGGALGRLLAAAREPLPVDPPLKESARRKGRGYSWTAYKGVHTGIFPESKEYEALFNDLKFPFRTAEEDRTHSKRLLSSKNEFVDNISLDQRSKAKVKRHFQNLPPSL